MLALPKICLGFFVALIHLVSAAFEGLSYVFIFVALSSLDSTYQVPHFLKWMLVFSPFLSFFLWSIGLQLIRSLLVFIGQFFVSKFAGEVEETLKNNLIEKCLSIHYSQFSRLSRSHLLDLLQTRYLRKMIEQAGNVCVLVLLSLGYLVIMFFLSWKLTFGVLVLLGMNTLLQKKILKHVQNYANKEEKRLKILTKRAYQRISFGKELFLSAQRRTLFSYTKENLLMKKLSIRLAFFRNLVQPIHEIASLFSLALVLILVKVFSPQNESFQLLFTFLPLTYRLGTRLQLAMQSITIVVESLAPIDEVKAFLKLPTCKQTFFPIPLWSELIVENLAFSYPEGFSFQEINLRIRKGSFNLIMGASGVGKSTLIDLILGLQLPKKGRIFLDKDSDLSLSSYQNFFGYVSQRPFLIEANIYRNIALNRKDISLDKVIEVSKKVGLHDFFSTLTKGYLTILGDQKGALSGGQKARIALARALVASHEVLVFDEPFSQLDQEREEELTELILGLNQTIILVSHRFLKMDRIDQLLVLEKGKLITSKT